MQAALGIGSLTNTSDSALDVNGEAPSTAPTSQTPGPAAASTVTPTTANVSTASVATTSASGMTLTVDSLVERAPRVSVKQTQRFNQIVGLVDLVTAVADSRSACHAATKTPSLGSRGSGTSQPSSNKKGSPGRRCKRRSNHGNSSSNSNSSRNSINTPPVRATSAVATTTTTTTTTAFKRRRRHSATTAHRDDDGTVSEQRGAVSAAAPSEHTRESMHPATDALSASSAVRDLLCEAMDGSFPMGVASTTTPLESLVVAAIGATEEDCPSSAAVIRSTHPSSPSDAHVTTPTPTTLTTTGHPPVRMTHDDSMRSVRQDATASLQDHTTEIIVSTETVTTALVSSEQDHVTGLDSVADPSAFIVGPPERVTTDIRRSRRSGRR